MAPSARKRERRRMSRKPLEQLSLGRILDPSPVSPLISTRNLVPGLSSSVVKLDKLGKGATSNVFRAVHAATLRMVALKEVVVSTAADRRAVRTEMRTLVTQRSPLLTSTFTTELAACPRIVEFYGSVVRENGNACIAVEYVAGGSLENWLESGCGCPEPWIAHIGYQALEALEFLRCTGRVHRDVKPANLLITRRGDLKLADFGAAGLENSMRMVGSQRFMAPERLDGGPATEKSDLWSLGLTLATAALGENPISLASNEFAQLSLAIRAQRTIRREADLSPDLVDFLCRCLAPDPARRPALRELMHHKFLKQRRDWQTKCPEVARAMRARKRRQREEARTLSTEAVLQALCQARAADNLGAVPPDPSTAADLAYELGVTPKSLVRAVVRLTEQLSGSCDTADGVAKCCRGHRDRDCSGKRGSGEAGFAGYGHESCGGVGDREGHGRGDGEGDGEARRRACGSECCCGDSDRGLSPMCSPPLLVDGDEVGTPAPLATVMGCSPAGSLVLPAWTPRASHADTARTPRASHPDSARTPRALHADTVRTPRASHPDTARTPRASHPDTARTPGRPLEISANVKLTPHKRRHELRRKASSLKKDPSPHRTARKQRRERIRAEREFEGGDEAEQGNSRGDGRVGELGLDKAVQAEDLPKTAISRMLPSRTGLMKSTRSIYELADLMKKEIKVKDRIYRFRVYKGCFSGREAVQWMLDGSHASSLNEALTLGNEMMNWGVFAHILNSHLFEDSSVYYQFTDGKPPPPPASGGRRLGQVARVVVKKIIKGVVGSKSGDEFEASLQEIVSKASVSASSDQGGVGVVASSRHSSTASTGLRQQQGKDDTAMATPPPTASVEETEEASVASGACSNVPGSVPPLHGANRPPRVPSSSIERKQSRVRRSGAGGAAAMAVAVAGSTVSQLRRFSSSISSATVPETPY